MMTRTTVFALLAFPGVSTTAAVFRMEPGARLPPGLASADQTADVFRAPTPFSRGTVPNKGFHIPASDVAMASVSPRFNHGRCGATTDNAPGVLGRAKA